MADIFPDASDEAIEVQAPSGASFHVLTESENQYFQNIAQRYLSDNKFTNVTDLQDLDRILMMETMVQRWNTWLSRETDYWGDNIDSSKIQKYITDFSKEIRATKQALGIDKSSRDKDKGESVQAYIENLRLRAQEFGYLRNEQAVKAITLWQQLIALVTFYEKGDDEEKKEFKKNQDDIFTWIRDEAIPEFEKIDIEFRKTKQRYWIRDV
jgi:hypothetical protein